MPHVTAYRVYVDLPEATVVRVHVTADERYRLFLDGLPIGRGSERGDLNLWFFETYDLALEARRHCLVAQVWSLGSEAPFAQMSLAPGFLLCAQESEWIERVGTGVANWEAKRLGGFRFVDPNPAWGTGANSVIDGAEFDWGFEAGEADGWQAAVVGEWGSTAQRNDRPPAQLLTPATLPPMLERPRSSGRVRLAASLSPQTEATHDIIVHARDNEPAAQEAWQRLIAGDHPVTVAPHSAIRVLIDLEDYVCAYPQVVTSGGAGSAVRVNWQESLYEDARKSVKGNRSDIEGKRFVSVWHIRDGVGDTFLPDGGPARTFEPLWWQCGRYVELFVKTAGEALTIVRIALFETRYPFEMEDRFSCDDGRLAQIGSMCRRTLQMCSHETYMDCPFFEQLMYIGDARIEALVSYATTRDCRLAEKSLRMFDASRMLSGLTQSRYPTRIDQVIPPFALWYVGMVYDYAIWRGDRSLLMQLMPGVRGILDRHLLNLNMSGLFAALDGWNGVDWVPDWPGGMSPGSQGGVSALLNWQLVYTLSLAASLEDWLDEPDLAGRLRRHAAALAARLADVYWDPGRALFAEDAGHTWFSEHSQCLAVLSGQLDADRTARIAGALPNDPNLARTTIYFSHYLFEAFRSLHMPQAILDRMDLWSDLEARGLTTTIEMPEPSRSDCHAWGSHPLYHFLTSLLGIRPGAFGFATVRIEPQLGSLTRVEGSVPHPLGAIDAAFRRDAERLHANISLPEGVTGTLVWLNVEHALSTGSQSLDL